MSSLYDVLKLGAALEEVEIEFTERGSGGFSFIVMYDERSEFPQRLAGEFKGRTADEAALVALQWARQHFPEISRLLTVEYLVQNPQFGMDSPSWKFTFLGLEGDNPILVKS